MTMLDHQIPVRSKQRHDRLPSPLEEIGPRGRVTVLGSARGSTQREDVIGIASDVLALEAAAKFIGTRREA